MEGVLEEVGRVNGGDMVNGLHIHIRSRTMKPLPIALSGAVKGFGRWWG
jgi:hypothetical protein